MMEQVTLKATLVLPLAALSRLLVAYYEYKYKRLIVLLPFTLIEQTILTLSKHWKLNVERVQVVPPSETQLRENSALTPKCLLNAPRNRRQEKNCHFSLAFRYLRVVNRSDHLIQFQTETWEKNSKEPKKGGKSGGKAGKRGKSEGKKEEKRGKNENT